MKIYHFCYIHYMCSGEGVITYHVLMYFSSHSVPSWGFAEDIIFHLVLQR